LDAAALPEGPPAVIGATIPGDTDIPGTTLDHMTSAAPPPGVSVADARLEEVADRIYAYFQPDGSWWINNTGFLVGRRGDRRA